MTSLFPQHLLFTPYFMESVSYFEELDLDLTVNNINLIKSYNNDDKVISSFSFIYKYLENAVCGHVGVCEQAGVRCERVPGPYRTRSGEDED